MSQPTIDAEMLASFSDAQLTWLANQPGPIKRQALDEQQRRASQSQS